MCDLVEGFPTDEKTDGVPVNERLPWRVGSSCECIVPQACHVIHGRLPWRVGSPCKCIVPQVCHVLPVGVVQGGIRVEPYNVVVVYV